MHLISKKIITSLQEPFKQEVQPHPLFIHNVEEIVKAQSLLWLYLLNHQFGSHNPLRSSEQMSYKLFQNNKKNKKKMEETKKIPLSREHKTTQAKVREAKRKKKEKNHKKIFDKNKSKNKLV